MTLGQKIKDLRKTRGLSLADLAKSCGCTASCIWNIEKLERNPSAKMLQKISDALNYPIDKLLETTKMSTVNNSIYHMISKLSKPQKIELSKILRSMLENEKTINHGEIQQDKVV